MTRGFLLRAGLLTVLTVSAAHADFVPALKFLNDRPFLNKAASSSISIQDLKGKTRCSATVISSKGHILTARHCIEDCLKAEGAYQGSLLFKKDSSVRVTPFPITSISQGQARCMLKIESSSLNLPMAEATLLDTGRGDVAFSINLDDQEKRAVDGLKEKAFGSAGDFAILQVGYAIPSCAKATDVLPAAEDSLYALGYPGPTARASANSDGRSLFGSEGKLTRGVQDYPGILAMLEPVAASTGKPVDFLLNALQRKYDFHDILTSTADMYHGNSGGGLFNAKGELVGVNIEGIEPAGDPNALKNAYVPGASRSLSIRWIREYMKSRPVVPLSQEKLDSYFGCGAK